jgi:hypothetical protein
MLETLICLARSLLIDERMKNKYFIIALLFPLVSFSQSNLSRAHLHTIVSIGAAAGQSAVKPLAQVSSGFTYNNRWFTGIGIGIDHYNYKSIPLFADLRMNFGKTRSGFLYGNAGYNFPYDNKSKGDVYSLGPDHIYGGFYMDAGIGYRIRLSSSQHLLFSAGYSQKRIKDAMSYNSLLYCPVCDGGDTYTYRYTMGRIITKLSWELGR